LTSTGGCSCTLLGVVLGNYAVSGHYQGLSLHDVSFAPGLANYKEILVDFFRKKHESRVNMCGSAQFQEF